ncbi:MAG: DNA-binding protein [Flavobacterium sp.]|uniref:DNA-binding protein n=1 Tax=Flavobacterium sp. TaxID=239 RepID=UPI00122473D8|nr:DNA-binding protein [Flavobacterium sp.]RZJ66945.1 MAG: DNA-binding protein [Flavobacterium sp.]
MKTLKSLERLQRLHDLIQTESTGTPAELAAQMDISERLVYNLIDMLKDFQACINYSRSRRTYFYEDDFVLKVNISVTVMTQAETREVFAGAYYEENELLLHSLFGHRQYIC